MITNKEWYIAHFPEAMFLCSQRRLNDYTVEVIHGKEIASRSNVLFCGIARNIERYLPYTIARIKALGSLFKSYAVFIFENDSNDRTLAQLQKWASEDNRVNIESATWNPPPFDDPRGRVRRFYMAKARNEYLKYAKFFSHRNLIDYIIIIDMDLDGGWSYHGILNSIGQNINWDIIGSNSLCYKNIDNKWFKLFYDSWAFRQLDNPEVLDDSQANLLVFNRGEPLVQVNSCFGGLAIYKPHFLSEGLYYTDADCDHPTLHNELVKRGYNIFLNPSQITLYNKSQYVI